MRLLDLQFDETSVRLDSGGLTVRTFNDLFSNPAIVSYFIYNGKILLNTPFELLGAEASHITQSRRSRLNDTIEVQDLDQHRFAARIIDIGKKSIQLLPFEEIIPPPESRLRLSLFQSLVKEKATDFILQKTTELGITNIIFFHSHHSQKLSGAEVIKRKLERWRKIALEACKQSGRAIPPAIFFLSELAKFDQFCEESSIETGLNLCLESSPRSRPIQEIETVVNAVNVFVGPEGGWSHEDQNIAEFQSVKLGPRVLRSDTAAITAIALLQTYFGDMGT